MPLRVKNIAAGFYDETGFHPIRRSPDYDADRAGDDYGSKSGNAGLRYKKGSSRKSGKKKTRGKQSKRAPSGKKGSRRKNPIPSSWVGAKVRRLPSGDLQVMLSPALGSRLRRRSSRRPRRPQLW